MDKRRDRTFICPTCGRIIVLDGSLDSYGVRFAAHCSGVERTVHAETEMMEAGF